MDIRITARHFDLTPELKAYAEKRVLPLHRYFDRIMDAHLILDIEKHRKSAELNISVYGQNLVSHAVTDDMFVSIDETTDKMERQLKRYSARFTEHRHLTRKEKAQRAEEIIKNMTKESNQAEGLI